MIKKIILILFIPIIIYANEFNLKDKYDMGDSRAGFLYAKKFFEKKEYKKSGDILFQIVQRGDYAPAYSLFGYQLEYGLGVEQNCKMAASMYMNAALKMNDCNSFKYIIDMINKNHCINIIDTEKRNALKNKFIRLKEKCLNKI